VAPGVTRLTEAVARGYHKLLAYKDEYEVARLYTESDFLKRVEEQFEGDYKLVFHLAPPTLAKKDAAGHLQKKAFGPWMLKGMRLLAKCRGLRGTLLDPFGRSADRTLDRQLIADYEHVVDEILAGLTQSKHETAVELAALPDQMRGFGHVRERYVTHARARQATLLAAFRAHDAGAAPAPATRRKTIPVFAA